MKKFLKILICVIIFALVVAYPIYVVVVYNTSKSPDPITMFPRSGVYTCSEDNFTITIDLSDIESDEEVPALATVLEQMRVIVEFDEKKFNLICTMSSGHGTLINPVAPSDILTFKSANVDSTNENYVHFSVSKYVFGEKEFYLKSFALGKDNNANIFEDVKELHFTKNS